MSKIEKNKTLYQLLSDMLIIPDYQRDYAQGRTNDLKIEDTRKISWKILLQRRIITGRLI